MFLTQPPVFYMGAGHVDWKVGCDVGKFVEESGCQVVDLA